MGNTFSSRKEEESSEEIATPEPVIEEFMHVEIEEYERSSPIDSPTPPSPASSTSELIVMEDEFAEVHPPEEETKIVRRVVDERQAFQHWVWKIGKTRQKTGTWTRTVKDARPSSTRLAAFGPPTSLQSLPLELLDMILALLSVHDLATAGRVSSLLLQRSSAKLYSRSRFTPAQAVLFVSARINDPPLPPFRIPHVTLPKAMLLLRKDKIDPVAFAPLFLLPTNQPPVPISRLEVKLLIHHRAHGLVPWIPLLRYLDPHLLQIDSRYAASSHDPPTIGPSIKRETVASFTTNWKKLKSVNCQGPKSIPLLEDNPEEFAFSETLRRNDEKRERELGYLLQQKVASKLSTEQLKEEDLATRLAVPEVKKPSETVGRWGLHATVESKYWKTEGEEAEGKKREEEKEEEEKKREEEELGDVWVEI